MIINRIAHNISKLMLEKNLVGTLLSFRVTRIRENIKNFFLSKNAFEVIQKV
jgi:hypothetical protein